MTQDSQQISDDPIITDDILYATLKMMRPTIEFIMAHPMDYSQKERWGAIFELALIDRLRAAEHERDVALRALERFIFPTATKQQAQRVKDRLLRDAATQIAAEKEARG